MRAEHAGREDDPWRLRNSARPRIVPVVRSITLSIKSIWPSMGELALVDRFSFAGSLASSASVRPVRISRGARKQQIRRLIEGEFEADRIGGHDGRQQQWSLPTCRRSRLPADTRRSPIRPVIGARNASVNWRSSSACATAASSRRHLALRPTRLRLGALVERLLGNDILGERARSPVRDRAVANASAARAEARLACAWASVFS